MFTSIILITNDLFWPFSAMHLMSSFKWIQAKYNKNFLRVPDVFSQYLQNKCYVYGI